MAANSVVRRKVEEVQAQAKAEREWWDEKRATIKTEFLKELERRKNPRWHQTDQEVKTTPYWSKLGDRNQVEGGLPRKRKGRSDCKI
jgi:hypothetical protein